MTKHLFWSSSCAQCGGFENTTRKNKMILYSWVLYKCIRRFCRQKSAGWFRDHYSTLSDEKKVTFWVGICVLFCKAPKPKVPPRSIVLESQSSHCTTNNLCGRFRKKSKSKIGLPWIMGTFHIEAWMVTWRPGQPDLVVGDPALWWEVETRWSLMSFPT